MQVDRLYCGNCLELLDDLDVSPNLIVLHPPDLSETGYDKKEYNQFLREVYSKCSDKLHKNGTLVSVNTDRKKDGCIYTKHIDIFNIMKDMSLFDYKIWAKTMKANLYVPTFGHILFYRKGSNFKNITYEYRPDVWLFEKDKIKKYPVKDSFPLKMISLIVNTFTKKGELVLDPFVGSGTTCVSAKRNGRKYIGFDISPDFICMSNKRLDETISNGN